MALFRTGGASASVKKTAAFTGYNEGSSYYMYGVDNSNNNYPTTTTNSAFTVTGLAEVGAGTSSRVVTAIVPLTVYVSERSGASAVTQHLNAGGTYTFAYGTKTLLLIED